MDEVVKSVVDRTGLPEDKARMAVETVANFLKTKLPGPVASQIDAALAGSSGAGIGGMMGNLGGGQS